MALRKLTVLLVYGEGGHRAQMKRLYTLLRPELSQHGIQVVGACEYEDVIAEFPNYSLPAFRDKYSWARTLLMAPISTVRYLHTIMQIARKYKVVGVISTGPGLAIMPSLVFKLMGSRIVFLESWSRFEAASLTGRIMYRIADRFYYQNKSLEKCYPRGLYGGML